MIKRGCEKQPRFVDFINQDENNKYLIDNLKKSFYKEVINMKKLSLIFRNISKLFKLQQIFLILFVISQIIACLAIFFSIGAIHNTRNEQKDIDIRTMYYEVYIEPVPLNEMQPKVERVLTVIPENIISSASIRGRSLDTSYYIQLNSTSNSIISIEQFQKGEKVIGVNESLKSNGKGFNIGDKIDFFGIEYVVTSIGDYVADFILPITAVDKSLSVDRLRIELNSVPEKKIADEIQNTINEVFPVITENHIPEIPDLMSIQFNRTMIITSAIVIAIGVLNLSYCYCYLFIQRKKMLSVYMMCGSSNNTATNMMITESVIISIICYLVATCIIKPFTLQIAQIYPAAEMLYSIKFFAVVGVAYIVLTAIILKIMFSTLLKKSAIELKRGV